jgi:formyltetrahydrofolate-dependent phosphoribosylglycinamide formyltransferase
LSDQPLRLIVLISGGGTNLQALIDAIESDRLNAEIVLVVSNRKHAYGLERAKKHSIPTAIFSFKTAKKKGFTRKGYDVNLAMKLANIEHDLIVLAGFMHILSEDFLDIVGKNIINLHPALSNTFAGINAIERTFKAYQSGDVLYGGCMIHYVIPEVDAGEVITQAIVPIFEEDTLLSFKERMHNTEHRIIVDAVREFGRQYREK